MATTQKTTAPKVDFTPVFDFTKLAGQFKVPAVDTDAVLKHQRKNIEALTVAQKVAFEGVQAVAQRQAEIARKSFEDAANVAKSLTVAGKPEDKLAQQADFFKKGYEQALADGRELVELGVKSNEEAVEVINQRVVEAMDEVKTAIKTLTNGK